MFSSKIIKILDFLKDKKKIALLTHDMADIDGFSSVFGLKSLLKAHDDSLNANIILNDISKHTKSFEKKFTQKFEDFEFNYKESKVIDTASYDAIMILDTNDLSQTILKDQKEKLKDIPLIFIDHHYHEKERFENDDLSIFSDETGSTAEIIYELFNAIGLVLSKSLIYLLISGIITDTGTFKYANNLSIKRVSRLLKDLKDDAFQEILGLIRMEKDISEKIAKIKGLQRAKFYKVNDWLIGMSNVSSYEGSVATAMLKMGFDVAFVGSQDKEETRISLRASKKICRDTSLHLGQMADEVASILKGNGGGHDGAAGLNGKFDRETAFDTLLSKIKEILN